MDRKLEYEKAFEQCMDKFENLYKDSEDRSTFCQRLVFSNEVQEIQPMIQQEPKQANFEQNHDLDDNGEKILIPNYEECLNGEKKCPEGLRMRLHKWKYLLNNYFNSTSNS